MSQLNSASLVGYCKYDDEIRILGTNMYLDREDIHAISIWTEIISISIFIVAMSCLVYIESEFSL